MAIPGTVTVTSYIAPTSTGDTYPVTDAIYGLDGLRNVSSISERNAIPTDRRRQGMIVGVASNATTNYWTLNGPPWNGTNSDWSSFSGGGSGSTPTLFQVLTAGNTTGGITISGNTTPNNDSYIDTSTVGKIVLFGGVHVGPTYFQSGHITNDNGIVTMLNGFGDGNDSYIRITGGQIGVHLDNVNISNPGIQYDADYSNNFTNESLITKRFTDKNYVKYTGSTTGLNLGIFGMSARTINISGSTSGNTSFRLFSGVTTSAITTPVNGGIINDNYNFYGYINNNWQQLNNLCGNFSSIGSNTSNFIVTGFTLNNNNYKIFITPTSIVSANLFYISNKSTTGFTLTFLTGITGNVNFDWLISN